MRITPARTAAALAVAVLLAAAPTAALAGPSPDAQTAAALARVRAVAPADVTERAVALMEGLDPNGPLVPLNILDPDDYECGPTLLDEWFAQNADFTDDEWELLNATGAYMIAMIEAAYLGDVEGTASYGVDGTWSKQINHSWKKLRTFWDEDSTEVRLAPAHGRALVDPVRVARVYELLGYPDDVVEPLAQATAAAFDTPRWDHGELAFFTANGFAGAGFEEDGVTYPDFIVIGDGWLDMMGELGYGAIAPQDVLAHENMHQVQFDLGDFEGYTTPEQSRLIELQADAGAAYSMSHPRGLSMQWNRIAPHAEMNALTGDCGFDQPGHHGTPNQRARAVEFGYRLQEDARPRGHVLPAATFIARVDEAIPAMTAPDAR